MMGINVRPLSRLLAVGGVGGVLGALAVGGPIGIIGGVLLGGLAEEMIARVRARNLSDVASMGWDWGRPRAPRLDPYGRPLPPGVLPPPPPPGVIMPPPPPWWMGPMMGPRMGAPVGSTLASGQALSQGQRLLSPARAYRLELGRDGNLMLRGPGNAVLWNAGITGATTLTMQPDGNLVATDASGNVKWASGSNARAMTHYAQGSTLTVQDDGNVTMHDPSSGNIVWATNTYQGGSGIPGGA